MREHTELYELGQRRLWTAPEACRAPFQNQLSRTTLQQPCAANARQKLYVQQQLGMLGSEHAGAKTRSTNLGNVSGASEIAGATAYW